MRKRITICLPLLAFVACCPEAMGQVRPQSHDTKTQVAQSSKTEAQKKNIQEYIALMRANVRDQKAEILGAVMQLDVDEAGKFWPIYSEYDSELAKLNNLRVENIEDYSQNYSAMTNDKADQLVGKAIEYQKQRTELLEKYYERIKESLGAVTAARFLQVEHQLLLIIDLQIDSSLPIVG